MLQTDSAPVPAKQASPLPWQDTPDPINSLDELIAESRAQSSPVFSLDDLLGESLEVKRQNDAEKDLKKKIQRGSGSEAELIADKARLTQWTRQREWKRSANVLVFTRQKCTGCGNFHNTFEGYFEQHTNTRLANTTMLTAVKVFELPELPKDVCYHDSVVAVCHSCADFAGWPLEEE